MLEKLLPIPKHSLEYNQGLDSLRGIAVVLVLLFHIYPKEFSFGYVGVDIFFVLSGYLITGIIINKIETGKFSFLEFYRNRIRRIFPAMIIVLLFAMIAGYIFLFPKELELFSKHAKSSFLFYQNITLINEAGYWDAESTKKPLLHFWSLSVEEQFYLFWPMLIVFLSRFGIGWQLKLLALLMVLFIISLFGLQDPFYGSFSRFWELALGGFVYSIKDKKIFEKIVNTVFVMIFFIFAIAFSYGNMEYSLLKTSLVVVSTSLLILSFGRFKNPIFGSNILLFFGLISYPLYLWHYVIIGYMHIFGLDVPDFGIWVVLISILLAYTTYRFVEVYSRSQTSYYFSGALLAIALCLVFVSMYIHKTRGLNQREHMKNIASANFDRAPTKDSNATVLIEKIVGKNSNISHMRANTNNLQEPFFMVVGDSHAYSIYDALAFELKEQNYKTILISNNSIPPFIAPKHSINLKVDAKNKTILTIIENIKPKNVIWISRGEIYASGDKFLSKSNDKDNASYEVTDFYDHLSTTFGYFDKKNIKLYFVLENPEMGFYPENCLKRPFFASPTNKDCSVSKNVYLKRQEKFIYNVRKRASGYKNIKIVDTANIFCDKNRCYAIKNGKLLYFDDNHLNQEGAKMQASEIVRQVFANDKTK